MSNDLKQLNISETFYPFMENLSKNADKPDRMPFIGRKKEIHAVMETLLRRLKHNLLLIGKPGVGKTALITEVAAKINKGEVPKPLQGKIILEFSLNRFFYSRDSEDELSRDLEQLFTELLANKEKVILFLDEMHLQSVPDPGKEDRQKQVRSILKSHIASRELCIITEATPETYYNSFKNDETLSLNFCPLNLEEPDEAEMVEILKGVTPYFEEYYGLSVPSRLLKKVVFLLENFTPHRAFPHKAIDLLDMCCSRASLLQQKQLTLEIIYRSISDICRLPKKIVKTKPTELRKKIKAYLEEEVVNQRDALEEISRIIKLSGMKGELNRTRPEGIFMFLGSAGVGKSYVARKIAEYLFGSREKLRVIDLQDYTDPEDFKKLISDNKSAPGILVDEVDRHPFSVILFENIGDADETVLSSLGKALNKGEIVDAGGKKHYISNIIFILSLTSIGEEIIENQIGFIKGDQYRYAVLIPPKIDSALDWVDEIIEFTPLSEEHLKQIAGDKLNDVHKEIKKKYNSEFTVSEGVFNMISKESLEEGGFAHTVSEMIDRQIKVKLLDLITKADQTQRFEVNMKENIIQVVKRPPGNQHATGPA